MGHCFPLHLEVILGISSSFQMLHEKKSILEPFANIYTTGTYIRIYLNATRWDYANECHAMEKYLYTHLTLTWNQMELAHFHTARYKTRMQNWDCAIFKTWVMQCLVFKRVDLLGSFFYLLLVLLLISLSLPVRFTLLVASVFLSVGRHFAQFFFFSIVRILVIARLHCLLVAQITNECLIWNESFCEQKATIEMDNEK